MATKVQPIYNNRTAHLFVEDSVTVKEFVINNEVFKTKALKMNEKIDLIGITQAASLVEAGVISETDSLKPEIYVSTVYFHDGKVLELDNCKFSYLEGGNFREMRVEHNVCYGEGSFALNGLVNIETGQFELHCDNLDVVGYDLEVSRG